MYQVRYYRFEWDESSNIDFKRDYSNPILTNSYIRLEWFYFRKEETNTWNSRFLMRGREHAPFYNRGFVTQKRDSLKRYVGYHTRLRLTHSLSPQSHLFKYLLLTYPPSAAFFSLYKTFIEWVAIAGRPASFQDYYSCWAESFTVIDHCNNRSIPTKVVTLSTNFMSLRSVVHIY